MCGVSEVACGVSEVCMDLPSADTTTGMNGSTIISAESLRRRRELREGEPLM